MRKRKPDHPAGSPAAEVSGKARSWTAAAKRLGLNRQTAAVLTAVFCVGLGQELWSVFFPKYLDTLQSSIFVVGLYASLRLLVEGFCFAWGGRLGQALGIRRALLSIGLVPLAGYLVFLLVPGATAAILSALLVLSWESLSVPGTFTVVGSSVGVERRSMAFALQSIQKRLPMILGPLVAGFLLARAAQAEEGQAVARHFSQAGFQRGMWFCMLGAGALAAFSLAVQVRWLSPAVPQAPVKGFWRSLREFPPVLKKMLIADCLIRWTDWLVREFVVLYCMNLLLVPTQRYGLLVAAQMTMALLTYLPMGAIVDLGYRRIAIALTLFFFALFPLALSFSSAGWTLLVVFLICGLREIGEPARKAVITSLCPAATRSESVGAYWAVRNFFVAAAPLAGAGIWFTWGPVVMLQVAGVIGFIATAWFLWFSRGLDAELAKTEG